ncbi:MAG: TPR end-of-group domain-containing protein [Isosphaeraceae bacterium]
MLEALEQIAKLKGSEVEYAYNLACLLSVKGRTGEAIKWLEHAVKIGWNDIARVKADPDLASLRNEKAVEVNDLVTVKFK